MYEIPKEDQFLLPEFVSGAEASYQCHQQKSITIVYSVWFFIKLEYEKGKIEFYL